MAFKPNEQFEPETEEDEKCYKPIAAINILQLMMCMDVTNYSETDQPIEAYKNQGFVPKFWNPENGNNTDRGIPQDVTGPWRSSGTVRHNS